jgi:hypothetical protein
MSGLYALNRSCKILPFYVRHAQIPLTASATKAFPELPAVRSIRLVKLPQQSICASVMHYCVYSSHSNPVLRCGKLGLTAAGAFCGFFVHLLPRRVSRVCGFLATSMYLLLLLHLILMQCDGTVYTHWHPLKKIS